MLDNEIILKLQSRNAQLEQQIDFLRGEMRYAIKAFSHHGLAGHAWVCGQALKICANKLNEGATCETN